MPAELAKCLRGFNLDFSSNSRQIPLKSLICLCVCLSSDGLSAPAKWLKIETTLILGLLLMIAKI